MNRVIDNFLPDWKGLRTYADTADYRDVVNPVDGVVYPGICVEVPTETKHEIAKRLGTVHGQSVALKTVFFRLSPKGTVAPHQAHTDSTMGQFSMMLYMNHDRDATGGTSLLRHRLTGIENDRRLTQQQAVLWELDTNVYSAWSITKMVAMRPNRAFIFDSHLFHRAEPVQGFGYNKKNARLVLTAFYDLGESDAYSIRDS